MAFGFNSDCQEIVKKVNPVNQIEVCSVSQKKTVCGVISFLQSASLFGNFFRKGPEGRKAVFETGFMVTTRFISLPSKGHTKR